MTPEQVNLLRRAAQTLLDHAAAGRKCDPAAIDWAMQVLAYNPVPKTEAGEKPCEA